MKATILFAGVPRADADPSARRLQSLGGCVLQTGSALEALLHLRGGVINALILDCALIAADKPAVEALVREAGVKSVPIISIGPWTAVDGVLPSVRLNKPLQSEDLGLALSLLFG